MRKKIGKRIGPVPIALVAVFALAAFIAAGLLLAPSGGQTAEAQGVPAQPDPAPTTSETKCTVTVHDGNSVLTGMVSGGGCVVSGESVDVIFENKLGTPDTTDQMQRIAVYITGGEDFPDVQATDHVVDNTADAVDSIVNLGKKGVDEEFLTIDERTSAPGNVDKPGSQTLTVTSSMAKDGQVYLFGYFASPAWAFESPDIGVPLSVFVDDDDRGDTRETAALALAATAESETNEAIRTARTIASELTDADGTASFTNTPNSLPDVDAAEAVAGTANEQSTVASARARINKIKGHPKYEIASTTLKDEVIAAELAIMQAQAAIDGIEDGDAKHFMNQAADFVVRIDFREEAVKAKLVGGKYLPNEEKGTPGSFMFTGTKASAGPSKELPNADKTADVYLEVRDENGVALAGFVQLTIDTSVSGGADATFVGSNRATQRVKLGEDVDDEAGKDPGAAVATVQGLPENDAIRIPITADFNDGELVLDGYIMRKGNAEMVSATAYVCERDDTDEEVNPTTTPKTYVEPAMVEAENACNTEIGALSTPGTSDDPTEVAALGPGAFFFIGAEAKDSVGNTVAEKAELSWSVTEDTDNEADAKTAIDGADSGGTNTAIMIADIDDAKPGTYSITVTDPDDDASTIVEITVSAEATGISVACEPEVVLTNSGLTECTVTVTDADGNIPSNLHKKLKDGVRVTDKVRVAVRSTDVSISGVDDNDDAELDDEGLATFSVLLREDAREGSVTIFVSSSIGDEMLRASTSVTYGDPPTEPGMPMNVMAEATSHDMITVTWESPADDGDITGYMVQSAYMMADDMMSDWMDVDPAHMGMDKMYMDSGLMAETTYYYRVVAMNSDGMGEYSDGMAMAMTMMMPPMELGDPSITNVMSDADGMATVMLMPGDNATKHWAWAEPTDGSEGMWHGDSAFAGDATMVTFSGLTSGMNYWFIAIAGRGTGTDSEWSAWSGWTAEKSIQ